MANCDMHKQQFLAYKMKPIRLINGLINDMGCFHVHY